MSGTSIIGTCAIPHWHAYASGKSWAQTPSPTRASQRRGSPTQPPLADGPSEGEIVNQQIRLVLRFLECGGGEDLQVQQYSKDFNIQANLTNMNEPFKFTELPLLLRMPNAMTVPVMRLEGDAR